MKCPFCGNDEDKVIDSRPARDGRAIRRRRECSACSRRYTTYEAPETNNTLIAKSDGSKETIRPFKKCFAESLSPATNDRSTLNRFCK